MPRAYRDQVRELGSVLGLGKEIFKPVKTLSGGMKKKLEIIRGLMHRPHVLFLDEPTAGLDAASRRNLWDYLREVRQRYETTIFLTTHYLEEAEEADRMEEYLVLDAADRSQLRRELEALGLSFTERGEFQVSLDGHTAQDVIRSLGVELTVLRTHSPSLEDAYLRIVGTTME
jgi:ABC-2 type transport system ATP-binding protein